MHKSLMALTLILASLLSHTAIAEPKPPTPMSVVDMMKDWSDKTKRSLVWEAGDAYNDIMLRAVVDMSSNADLERAFAAVSTLVADRGIEPLKLCLHPNAMVVRRVSQTDCGVVVQNL